MDDILRNFCVCFLMTGMVCTSCKADVNDPETPEEPSLPAIVSFTAVQNSVRYEGEIDQEAGTVTVSVPADFDIRKVLVEVECTEGAELSPESGYEYNFSKPVEFKVSDADGSRAYTVTIGAAPELLSFEVPAYYRSGEIDGSDVNVTFTYGTDISAVIPEISVSSGCSVEPASGSAVDLREDVTYTVTNTAGVSAEYTVHAEVLPQEHQVRAVWVPDPTHTSVLHNYRNMQDFISLLDELNFNAIYLATWVREQTLYKSEVLKANANYAAVEDGWMLNGSAYDGPSGDPVADLISLAHESDIKVFFWFEYGFMRSGGAEPPADHPILSVHPDWDGVNSDGTAANYNGTDYYLNSYDPEVQDFMLELILESVRLYPDVDGVQGDDRLPAAPRNSGYNAVTKALYKAETGKDVPASYNDANWVEWRLEKLNSFGKRLYDEVKKADPELLVSFSPNPYPWCMQNLMQDWPSWLEGGYVDILSVQCYRETEESYRNTLEEAVGYVKASTDKNVLNPGIYLRSGDAWGSVFASQMLINREFGTNGEAFFFNEGLGQEVNREVIKAFYTGKAVFPTEF